VPLENSEIRRDRASAGTTTIIFFPHGSLVRRDHRRDIDGVGIDHDHPAAAARFERDRNSNSPHILAVRLQIFL
jgi:hypothetical protein